MLLAFLLIAVPAVSYGRALAAPGYAPWADTTSTWIREHGGGTVLDAYENWRYASPPPDVRPDLPPRSSAAGVVAGGTKTPLMVLPTLPARVGQSAPVWEPGRITSTGAAASYTSVYQPDAAHLSVVAGVAIISRDAVVAHLTAGTTEPVASTYAPARLPAHDIPSLVAVFNSGFKFHDIDGGYLQNGITAHPLVEGEASAVIDDGGHLSVIAWTASAARDPHTVAVRQNLAPIVERGRMVDGLGVARDQRWGDARSQLQYTERSGLGTTATGDLVYVAGGRMNLTTLATALLDAGATTAMELDIHTGLTAFNSWAVDTAGALVPSVLVPTVQHTPSRYLDQDRRDFFYLTLASPTPSQPWRRPQSQQVWTAGRSGAP